MTCPFCELIAAQKTVVCSTSTCIATKTHRFADAYPVTPGHMLIVPGRHVVSWFDLSNDEQFEMVRCLRLARLDIQAEHPEVTDFNIGVNSGPLAGQTVGHVHMHLIPRYANDTPNPRGGVRNVIAGQGDYLIPPLQEHPLTVPVP